MVTVSEFSKTEIKRLVSVDDTKIDVVYNGISHMYNIPTISGKGNEYGKYLLTVSSINPRKNFRNLILAFNHLKLPDIKLLIVGSKNKILASEDFKEIVENNPNIIFSGYVSDEELVHLYKQALLFVYPSLYEGFGIPPLEAMTCGCPTLVSNKTSLPEVCGDASYYINSPHIVQDIAHSLENLLHQPEVMADLVHKGYERVKQFSWESSSKKMAQLINELQK